MEELNVQTIVFMFRKVLCDLHKARSEKGQKTDWIDDLMSFSDRFNEDKIVQVIKLLASANELEPVGIGQIAWIVKDIEFNKFDKKSMSRVNMYVEILMRLLRRYELVVFKKNGLYTKKNRDPEDEDDENKPDTCTGMWLNRDSWDLSEFGIKERLKYDVYEEPERYHGQMSGDKYTQQKCKNYDRCAETLDLLNSVAYKFDKDLCKYKAKKYDEPKKAKQWEYWEKHVMQKVYLISEKLDRFHVSFRPEKRLRCLIENDVGNYIMLKNVRHRIEFAENEVFKPDAVEED